MLSIDALVRPINQLIETFGTGISAGPGPEFNPPELLAGSAQAMTEVFSMGTSAISEVAGIWSSLAAEAAIARTTEAQAASAELSTRSEDMGIVVAAAMETVARGVAELEGVAASFIAIAIAASPTLATPPGQMALIATALEHLGQALAIVAKIRAELTVHTAEMSKHIPDIPLPPAPNLDGLSSLLSTHAASAPSAPTIPQNASLQSLASGAHTPSAPSAATPGHTFTGAPMGSAGGRRSNAMRGPSNYSGPSQPASHAKPRNTSVDPREYGAGVQVYLPDGSTAMAPNAAAADAVRNALSQQGVPYVWGGNNPGVGLDCSGLTKWAYGEAGIELPRLAQEQGIGAQVDPGSLLPGDLAVWDGHVAMVIGNGQMIEAGDPIQVGPIRTSNIGMGFYGFYRPTG
ncbi:MAG: C40 family peptidase [Mycobacteriaceae bacterium]